MASHAEDKINQYAPEGEYVAVRREVNFAKSIGCKYHFCHMSTKESFEAILKARKEGYTNITFEVSPHHLLLNEEMIKDANWKMNPPLRSEENRLATMKALLETEGRLLEILQETFANNSKTLYEDILENRLKERFKN